MADDKNEQLNDMDKKGKHPLIEIRIPDVTGEQGSKNVAVLCLAIGFFVLMGVGSLYVMLSGPNADSVFRIYCSPLAVYFFGILGLLVSVLFTWLGICRLHSRRSSPD